MGPSNTDNGRSDDPAEVTDTLGADPIGSDGAAEAFEAGLDELDGLAGQDVQDAFDEDPDGLAPEAGRRTPSVLSVLLLVAGAIWIVVALLKIGDRETNEDAPAAALSDGAQSDAGAPLPDIDDAIEPAPPGPDDLPDELAAETTGSPEELAPAGDDEGDPANPRGPPDGSLLAGKVWPRDYVAPEIVRYTIKRGGSMKVVANLYKIFHHEMEALNPGVDIDRELPPSTKLVVYKRKPGTKSESIDYAGDGSLVGAMPMVDGPGRILKHTPWKGWATTTTVGTLDLILKEWARRFPNRQPILVGNMSARDGGRLKPHSSHQSGRDVDLSYPQIWDRKEELNWRKMDAQNLDRELTWELLELLRETGAIEVIFIDSKLQKLLYEHARATERYTESELAEWLEYPKPPGSGHPMIQHVRGHDDHIHVRFKCTESETRCKNRER